MNLARKLEVLQIFGHITPCVTLESQRNSLFLFKFPAGSGDLFGGLSIPDPATACSLLSIGLHPHSPQRREEDMAIATHSVDIYCPLQWRHPHCSSIFPSPPNVDSGHSLPGLSPDTCSHSSPSLLASLQLQRCVCYKTFMTPPIQPPYPEHYNMFNTFLGHHSGGKAEPLAWRQSLCSPSAQEADSWVMPGSSETTLGTHRDSAAHSSGNLSSGWFSVRIRD